MIGDNMAAEFLSCPGQGLSPARWIGGWCPPAAALPEGFGFSEAEVVYTYQGRYAIQLICRLLSVGPGDEILAPAYNCGAEIDPFVRTGAKVIFYRIDGKARIDTGDVTSRITPSTKLIYVSHFFGWPQNIEGLAGWCREKHIFLVEDCALSLFSRSPRSAIGRAGDAAIFSFVKTLAVPDGGALILKNHALADETKPRRQPPSRNIVLNSLPLMKKWFMNEHQLWQRSGFARRLLTRSWRDSAAIQDMEVGRGMPESNYFDEGKIGWTISRLSRRILAGTHPAEIVATRRHNYRLLQDAFFGLPSIRPLYDDLPDHVCPLSFPLFIDDRSRWAQALEERGIQVGGWPSYHRGFDWRDFPEARHLKDDLLTLPVHQDLDGRHMGHIAQSVKAIAEDHDYHHSR